MKFEDIKKEGDKTAKWGREIEQLVEDRLKPGDLVRQHLASCGDDLILITLKGHLIVENLLEMNLARLLGVENLSKREGRLGFNQKLKLVQAVMQQREPESFHEGPNADLFCAIDKLNDIRNQLAHKLKNQGEIEKDVRRFIDEYRTKADIKLVPDKALPTQLKICIVKLCRFLDEVRVHFYKLKQRGRD